MLNLPNTLFIGKVLKQLQKVDSTNSFAKNLMSKTKPVEGTAILAYNQQAGKGQFGNNWQSEAGKNLIVSYIMYPTFLLANKQFYLNMVVSLTVRAAVESLSGLLPLIKWPNDIMVNNKKICGILIENSLTGTTISDCIIGLGLNVNQIKFEKNLSNASSIKLECGEDIDLNLVFNTVSEKLEHYYLMLKANRTNQLEEEYYRYLFQYNKPANYIIDDMLINGTILGVNQQGQLKLQVNGKIKYYNNKAISFIL